MPVNTPNCRKHNIYCLPAPATILLSVGPHLDIGFQHKLNNARANTLSISPKLVGILRCPVSQQELRIVAKAQLERINAEVSEGTLLHEDGTTVAECLEAALVTASGDRLYRIEENIPIMLAEQSVPLPVNLRD